MRHDGHLFVLFVACLWLAALPMREWRLHRWLDRWAGPWTRPGMAFVTVVLLIQVAAASLLYVADLRRHFSAAPQAAEFIRASGLDQLPIAASPAPVGSSVAGLLDRPIHYLAFDSAGTFVRWTRYRRYRDRNLSMDRIRPFLRDADSDVLLILGSTFADWDPGIDVEELVRLPAGLEHREGYVIYRIQQPAP